MQKKLIFIFLSLFLGVFLFSGCSLKKTPILEDQDSWEDEILMAQECGMDGLKCCQDDPACYYGQLCCTAPDNSGRNYCAESCDFGTQNSFCREADPKCNQSLACFESFCLNCGDENELCCENSLCNDSLVCHNNKCVPCGLSGNPCCDNLCIDDNLRIECNKGVCQECGFSGRSICQNNPLCEPEHLQNNNICLECGKLNLPCCDTELEDIKPCAENLMCQKGFCGKK